ncbi:DMT family transporter [Streptomyces sp. NPDC001663]|uniref:EamA family transporter n=1 Tax=Streptomyces sp. NPDC001663 TaxID=3364597 RepID=UPI0036B4F67F
MNPPSTWSRGAGTGALLAVVAMIFAQFGMAISVGVIKEVGPEGATWLRLFWAAILFVLLGRPHPGRFTRATLRAGALLGVATAGLTLSFMAAAARLPLGTATALEFLGPLTLAVVHGRGRSPVWPGLAAVGVVCITEPWQASSDLLGILYTLAAAVCWAVYIVLTQRMSDAVAGFGGLAISMPVAALVATGAAYHSIVSMDVRLLATGIGIALLLPVIPVSLEIQSLRSLNLAAFGTLVALEPAVALLVGLIVLDQTPGTLSIVGIGLVVLAGVGAARTGARGADPVVVAEDPP